jgi:CBS domain-containing protein
MRVGEYCTREVVVIRRESTVIEAARLMRDHHVGDLVVVEERDGERVPVGILTDRDIVVEVIAKDADYLPSLIAGDIMSMNLMTARENESLSDALKSMCSQGVRRIPVVNDRGGLEGILSIDDLLEQVCEELTDITRLIAWQQKREKDERA